jgi:AcrR family transcriptional regulator
MDGEMTQLDIIETAFRVWGRTLYLDTSLSDLARELGVSKPALYRHFRNKQALKDAMKQHFYDHYADFVRADFQRALAAEENIERMYIMIRSNVDFYARDCDALIFVLMEVYKDREQDKMSDQLLKRGIDMRKLQNSAKFPELYPLIWQFIASTLIFWLSFFHKCGQKPVLEEAIRDLSSRVEEKTVCGLGLDPEKTGRLDFDSLEASVACRDFGNIADDGILKAVAEAVAEAGPWNASMDMVARRSGLSKSSLYGHFKNKKDMLRQLFITEFTHIAKFAREGISHSDIPEEQLYLGIFSIAAYLRSRPEILVALDWIRTRRLDLGRRPAQLRGFLIFEEINLEAFKDTGDGLKDVPGEGSLVSHWIFFLIVSTLMRHLKGMNFADLTNESIRVLYRLIVSGVKGFQV